MNNNNKRNLKMISFHLSRKCFFHTKKTIIFLQFLILQSITGIYISILEDILYFYDNYEENSSCNYYNI